MGQTADDDRCQASQDPWDIEEPLVVELDDEELPEVGPAAWSQAQRGVAVCARYKRPFYILLVPRAAQQYAVVGAEKARLMPSGPAGGRIEGTFDLRSYPGCPWCGARGLVLSSRCGTLSCSAARERKGGGSELLPCPVCGWTGPVKMAQKLSAPSAKGGKGSGKK